jgi:hypothetical protein
LPIGAEPVAQPWTYRYQAGFKEFECNPFSLEALNELTY